MARFSVSAFDSFFTSTGAAATFSNAVMWGKRLKRWKTMPISVRRRQTSRSGSSCSRPAALLVADERPVDVQPSRVDLLEVVDTAQEGRLAGAGRAQQAHHLAGRDLEALCPSAPREGRNACARPRRGPSARPSTALPPPSVKGTRRKRREVAPDLLYRRERQRVRAAAGVVALDVVLADREHRRHEQVPEARHDVERDHLVGPAAMFVVW